MTTDVIPITSAVSAPEVEVGTSALSESERQRLEELEFKIEMYQMARWDAAAAIAEVHDTKLYRDYGTFEAYCEIRWGWSRRYGYQLMTGYKLMHVIVSHGSHSNPDNERQVRPLASLQTVEQVRDAWGRAEDKAKAAGKKITSTLVAEAVKEVKAESGLDGGMHMPTMEALGRRHEKLKQKHSERVDYAIDSIEMMADFLDKIPLIDDTRSAEWADRLREHRPKISRFIARCRKMEKAG